MKDMISRYVKDVLQDLHQICSEDIHIYICNNDIFQEIGIG